MKRNTQIVITILGIGFFVLLLSTILMTTLSLGSGECSDLTVADFAFTTLSDRSDMMVRITFRGGDSLPANRTFVIAGTTAWRWASLQITDANATIETGENVTIEPSRNGQIQVVFQRPPPDGGLFEEACYTTRNRTLETYNYTR